MRATGDTRPWYAQFWPWFLIGLPAASVVGSIAAVVIAVHNADSLVRDDWYKSGLAINADLARDREASRLGLLATIAVARARHELTVTLDGAGPDEALDVELLHPTQAARDRTLHLARDAAGVYRGGDGAELRGRWYVVLTAPGAPWRLAGPMDLAPGTSVRLGSREETPPAARGPASAAVRPPGPPG